MHYLFENVFTNQNTRAVVIDPFESSQTHYIPIERFKNNLYKHLHKIEIITGFSGIELPKLTQMFDLIYIDGDHSSTAVLEDALFSFRLLKPGGYIVFDDYLWGTVDRGVNSIEIPYKGINIFLKYFESEIELIKSNWQIIVRKK